MVNEAPRDSMRGDSVCAVVVTFWPDAQIVQRLNAAISQVAHVIVVDNASSGATIIELRSWTDAHFADLLTNDQNLGVATGLNQGFELAISKGYAYVLALDQDSLVQAGMVRAELDQYHIHPNRARLAVVAPRVLDPDNGIESRYMRPRGRFFFERVGCGEGVINGATNVIGSGALFSLGAFGQIGRFRDDYFVDYVDTEYCLRARRCGFDICVACDARLQHKWGDVRRVQIGPVEVRPTFHVPKRWYFISRNRVDVIRNHGLHFPHFLLYDLLLAVWWLVRMLLFEDRRLAKMAAVLRGTLDGLRGRMGPGPAARLREAVRHVGPNRAP